MKFSLATLLLWILLAALGCAALVNSNDTWRQAMVTLALSVLLIATLAAAVNRSRVFALGFAVAGWIYLLEFHKQFDQLNEQGEITYDYFHSNQPDEEIITRTYADGATHEPLKEYWWNHTMSDIVTAILRLGLQITLFHEFPYSAYKLSETMAATGRWRIAPALRGGPACPSPRWLP